MNQDSLAILLLRLAYWAGATVDAVVAVLMFYPRAYGQATQLPDFSQNAPYRYAMALGASLMAGWTLLLIWADRKPVERRGVLLITVFPVVVGVNLSKLLLVQYRVIDDAFKGISLISPGFLILLFLFAYLFSLRVAPFAADVKRQTVT
jgi:hypothetical protein